MNYRFIVLSVLILSAFVGSQSVFSQTPLGIDPSTLFDPNTGLPSGITEQISIEQIPQIPKPGEVVSFRIESYLTNLNKAKITWSQDGKVLLSQTGAVTNQVQAPQSGKSSTVTITIQKETGGVLVKTITLTPADVDLIYEAETYVHPFFKGKKLFTSESTINFIALPNFVSSAGVQISASNLVYTWKINGTVQQSISGYGRYTFKTKGSLIERPLQVEVEVSALNSNLKASQTLDIRSNTPELLIYENNPLLGIMYEQAVLGEFLLERSQVDFEAVPYFFSANTKDDLNMNYKWTINGVHVASKSPKENYLLLQNNENQEGRARISLVANHVQNILQSTQTSLGLDFKKIKDTSNETSAF